MGISRSLLHVLCPGIIWAILLGPSLFSGQTGSGCIAFDWEVNWDGDGSSEEFKLRFTELQKQIAELKEVNAEQDKVLDLKNKELAHQKTELTRAETEKKNLLQQIASLKVYEGKFAECESFQKRLREDHENLQTRYDQLQTSLNEEVKDGIQPKADQARSDQEVSTLKGILTQCQEQLQKANDERSGQYCLTRDDAKAIIQALPLIGGVIMGYYCFKLCLRELKKILRSREQAQVERMRTEAEIEKTNQLLKLVEKTRSISARPKSGPVPQAETLAISSTPPGVATSGNGDEVKHVAERVGVVNTGATLPSSAGGLRHRRWSGSSNTTEPTIDEEEERSYLRSFRRSSESSRTSNIDTPVLSDLIRSTQALRKT